MPGQWLTPKKLALLTEVLRTAAAFAASVILTPLLLHHLGFAQFGIWVTLGSVMSYLGNFDLGIGVVTPKLFAEQFALQDEKKIRRLLSTLLAFFVVIGLLLFLTVFAFGSSLESFLNIPPDYASEARILLSLLTLSFGMGLVANVGYGFLFGANQLYVSNLIGVVSLMFLVPSTWFVLQQSGGLLGVGFVNLLVTGLGLTSAFLYIKRNFPHLSWGIRMIDTKLLRSSLSLSSYILISNIAVQIIYNTDNIIITKFLGPQQVASYAIAFRLCQFTFNFNFIFNRIFLPEFSALQATQNSEKLGPLFLRCSRISAAIGSLVTMTLVLWGEAIIHAWTGASSYVGDPTLFTLAALALTTPLIQAAAVPLLAMEKVRAVTWMGLVEAALNLTLSLFLVRTLGVWGVALGTLLAQLATNAWFVPWYTTRKLAISTKEYLRRVLIPAWTVAIPATGIAYSLSLFYPPSTTWILVGEALVVLSFYSVLYWYLFGRKFPL